jgi:peptidoglycan/LPS O-acetylase OafA/YrhL
LTWGLTFIDIYSGALILCAMRPGSIANRIFDVPAFRWIDRISYGVYVFHDIPHGSYKDLVLLASTPIPFVAEHDKSVLLPLALSCTLLISHLSYSLFETPFLNLKERWTR